MTHELEVSSDRLEPHVMSEEALQRIFNAWQRNGHLEGEVKSEWRELRERAIALLEEDDD